jgi:glutamate dehydrogenase/leucine dehydrogenase
VNVKVERVAETGPPYLEMTYRDPAGRFEGTAVIDSLYEGCAAGGVRVTPTVTASEVARLARGMTFKMRVMGLSAGGVKYGLRWSGDTGIDKVSALSSFFEAVGPVCERCAGFGPDMNTTPEELDAVAQRIGLSSRHIALVRGRDDGQSRLAEYHACLERPSGPLRLLETRTGAGVASAAAAAAEALGLEERLRIGVYGFGQVGTGTAWTLHRMGHAVTAIADLSGSFVGRPAIDIPALLERRRPGDTIEGLASAAPELGLERVGGPAEMLGRHFDVLVLAGNSFAVTPDNVDRVAAELVVEGGNLAVTPAAERALFERNIRVVPDFVASAGAIALVVGVIRMGWSGEPDSVLERIGTRIARATRACFRASVEQGVLPRVAVSRELGIPLGVERGEAGRLPGDAGADKV